MKLILILIAVLLSVVSSAAPHYHRTRPRIPTARRIIRAVPWKTVLAGGAAAGTVIAAYKISNGVEDGIKTVAKEKPEVISDAISDAISVVDWFVRLSVLLLVAGAGYLLGRKWFNIRLNTTKGYDHGNLAE